MVVLENLLTSRIFVFVFVLLQMLSIIFLILRLNLKNHKALWSFMAIITRMTFLKASHYHSSVATCGSFVIFNVYPLYPSQNTQMLI